MRSPATALREVHLDYLAFYRATWAEGKLSVCNEAAVKSPARRLLASDAGWPEGWGRLDVYGIARGCLAMKGERGEVVFRKLAKAFEFLELICVNLFLSPWRREIKSLKTFTGNFVYYVQSVLPEGVVQTLLEEMGYVATTATEFSLVRKLNEEEAEQAAFEIFLARIQCEDLLHIAEDARESDLGDILQKRAQKHWRPEGNPARKHPPSQGKESVMVGGRNERQGCFGPQPGDVTPNKSAFEEAENPELRSGLGLQCTTDEPRATASELACEQNMSQESQAGMSASSCVKSTDSEDFLMKYSDIVIGQKPLHFADLSPKVSDDATRTAGLTGPRLGPPPNGARPLALLSPDASGPQALAILNDVTLESRAPYGYGSRETIESKICDAMQCLTIHGSDPMDQPQELKGGTEQHGHHLSGRGFSRKEGTSNLSSKKKLKLKGDTVERLVHPVEETAQPESTGSKRGAQGFDLSQVKLTDLPGDTREGFNIDLYSSDVFCNITDCQHPAVGSSYSRLLAGRPGACEAGEYFRHGREPDSSTCTVPPEVQYRDGIPASVLCRGEGCPLHASFADFEACVVPVNETCPEGYIIINQED
ncbi:uncharacterized protein LOC134408606 [Elgaria multicarinata webbii]|uniref:uncharacterized protein LOC134408606 n=1 Tax=Elgaria multicarinata webbii TaxID=159646 RepID=UPI002FCD5BA7